MKFMTTTASPVLAHLKKLVRFRTSKQDDDDFEEHEQCTDYLERELERKGFETHRFTFNKRPSVVGWTGSRRGRTLVYNGHYDVAADNQEWDAFELKRARVHGQKAIQGKGVADMKGEIACFLAALPLARLPKKHNRLVAMFVPDEETGGVYGTKAVLKACVRRDVLAPEKTVAVVGEPTQMQVTTRRRALYAYEITIPRKREVERVAGLRKHVELSRSVHSAHTSVSNVRYGRQRHPLFEIAERYFAGKLMGIQEVRLGGTRKGVQSSAQNVVPSMGAAYYDGRQLPEPGTHRLLSFVQKLFFPPFHSHFSHYGISIGPNRLERFQKKYALYLDVRIMNNNRRQLTQSVKRLASECGINKSNVKLVDFKHSLEEEGRWPRHVAEVAGKSLRRPISFRQEGRGQSDASFFAARGIPVVELGCKGGRWHAPYEYVTMDSLETLPKAYAALITSTLSK